MTAPTTVCYRHPSRSTGLSCSECGRPICSECSIDAVVGQKCPECVRRAGRQHTIQARRGVAGTLATAPGTRAILAVTVAVFVTGFLFPGFLGGLQDRLLQSNQLVAAGEWWRIITAALLHGSLLHLVFNMWALAAFGPGVERRVGKLPFVTLYLASAAAGGAFAFHLGQRSDLLVGASGAIFGLIGLWLHEAVRRRETAYGRWMLSQLGFLLLVNGALPLLFPQISWQGHLGGLAAGFLIGEAWSRLPRHNPILRASAALGVLILAVGSVLA